MNIKYCRDLSIHELATSERKVKKKPVPGRARRNNESSPCRSSVQSPLQSPTPNDSDSQGDTPIKRKVHRRKKKKQIETDDDRVSVQKCADHYVADNHEEEMFQNVFQLYFNRLGDFNIKYSCRF